MLNFLCQIAKFDLKIIRCLDILTNSGTLAQSRPLRIVSGFLLIRKFSLQYKIFFASRLHKQVHVCLHLFYFVPADANCNIQSVCKASCDIVNSFPVDTA